jgi:hypothetical protein
MCAYPVRWVSESWGLGKFPRVLRSIRHRKSKFFVGWEHGLRWWSPSWSRIHVIIAVVPALLVAGVSVSSAQPATIGYQAREQIAALVSEKLARSAAEKKLDSRLIRESEKRRGKLLSGVQVQPRLRSRVAFDTARRTLVDLRASVSDELLARIADLDGRVVSSFPEHDALRARLSLEAIEALAHLPDVRFIRPAMRPMTNQSNTSEGDVAHRADIALGRSRCTCSAPGIG